MYKKHEMDMYDRALELRQAGLSLGNIAKELSVSKSTISRWINNLATPEMKHLTKPMERVLTEESRRKMSEAAKKGNALRDYKRKDLEDLKGFNLIRERIFEERGRKCEQCGWCELNPSTGTSPVQVHHIDGDRDNNTRDNLIVLCPNCHSLTPNFMFYGKSHKQV